MRHWSEKYLGRPWTPTHDCAAFARDVLREQFGVEVALPSGFDWRRTKPRKVMELAEEFAVRSAVPFDGAGALMELRGNRLSLGSHIGVVCMIGGHPWVLHCMERMGSVFHPVPALVRVQLEVRAWYRLRHV